MINNYSVTELLVRSRSQNLGRILFAAFTSAAVALVFASGASAATGSLTDLGCFEDVESSGSVPCAGSQQGLLGANDVAVSPDGKSVYVVGYYDDAIVRFDRNPATGALAPMGCIADVGVPSCGVNQQGLDDPYGVAVSPDGKSVYVAAEGDNSVVEFARDTTTGALTGQGCFDITAINACGLSRQFESLGGASDVVVSPDNLSVYVTGNNAHAVTRFIRDTTTGLLTYGGCIDDTESAACSTQQQGLGDVYGLAISPDGKSLYTVSRGDAAIAHFTRSLVDGGITAAGCIADVGVVGCAANQHGLAGSHNVVVTSDNASVYVAGGGDDAIVRFDRTLATGVLTGQGCIADPEGTPDCAVTTAEGLDKAYAIAASPDGMSIYATGASDHALVTIARNPMSGAITYQGSQFAAGLGNPYGVAVSPDDDSVYAVGEGTGTIHRFFRETPGNTVPPTDEPPPTSPTPTPPIVPPNNNFDVPNPFRQPNNGTVTYRFDLPGGGSILVHATGEVRGPPRVSPTPYALRVAAKKRTITIARVKKVVTAAGVVKVVLKPTKLAMKYLKARGRLSAKVKITYTPTGGTAKTLTDKVTFSLKKKRRR